MLNAEKQPAVTFTKEEIAKVLNNAPQFLAQIDKGSLNNFMTQFECGNCDDSYQPCPRCGKMMCTRCVYESPRCEIKNCGIKDLCRNCWTRCDYCYSSVQCSTHIVKKCEKCGKQICELCVKQYKSHYCLPMKRRKSNI